MSELDHETMWTYLRDLLGRVCGALDGGAVMADGLDAIIDLLHADRGLVFLADGEGVSQAIVGRRQRRPMEPIEREEIAKTFVRRALETGRYVQFDRLTEQSLSASANSLGIVAALAAPLALGPGARVRGVLYLDFRDRRRAVEARHLELFLTAATVFGLLIEQEARGERVKGELDEAKRHSVHATAPVRLEDLLDFPSLAALREEVDVAVRSASPILVLGESGSGKTMLAHAIAEASGRKPIVRVMLGASDDLNTITSELFGHERGAFTGAATKRIGLVEYASGGTLVLDELLNLPPHAQRLFLDFVQFGTFRPLGHERQEPKRSNVRIIAATNGDIRGAMRDGRLREDLYHRLAHVELEMPPLRARRADIPLLAERFLKRADPSRPWTLALEVRRLLISTDIAWAGNIRQLERVVMRARDRAAARDPESTTLLEAHFDPKDFGERATPGRVDAGQPRTIGEKWQVLQTDRSRLDEQEKDLLREALSATHGVVAHAARELGVARTTLSSRLDALGLRAPRS